MRLPPKFLCISPGEALARLSDFQPTNRAKRGVKSCAAVCTSPQGSSSMKSIDTSDSNLFHRGANQKLRTQIEESDPTTLNN